MNDGNWLRDAWNGPLLCGHCRWRASAHHRRDDYPTRCECGWRPIIAAAHAWLDGPENTRMVRNQHRYNLKHMHDERTNAARAFEFPRGMVQIDYRGRKF